MNKYLKISLFLIIQFVLIGACLSLKQASPKIEYYTLDYAPTRMIGFSELPLAVKVGRFTAAPLYNTNRIIYQDQVFKRDAYIYHRWRVQPKDMLTHLLTRDFRSSGLFKAVLSCDNHLSSSYILDGNVDEFLEIDTEKKWEAILTISVMLIQEDNPDNGINLLFQKIYQNKTTCSHKNPTALAEAMSLNMSVISREMIKDIYDHLKEHEIMS